MLNRYIVIRALRYASVALLLVCGFEALRTLSVQGGSAAQSHATSVLLCAGAVLFQGLASLCREHSAQEESFATVVANLPEIACLLDDTGRLSQWNSNLERALGYSQRDLHGLAAVDMIAEEHRENGKQTIAEGFRQGFARTELVLVTKEGARISCFFTGVRVVVHNRPCVLAVAVDLRKIKAIEEGHRESKEQYQSLVANIPEVVWKSDANGHVTFVGNQVAALLGYTTEEIYERGDSVWFDSIHAEDRERVRQAFQSLVNEGGVYDVECRVRKKNGEWFWAHDRGWVGTDHSGVRVVTGIVSDITHRKMAEEATGRLASIVECSSDAIIGKNNDGIITNWNWAAEQMYGYTVAEAVGQHISMLLAPDRHSEITAIMERIRNGQAIECLETQRLTKAGSELEVSISISPIRDGSGRISGASTIARDITLRKRAERQLILQSAALEAAANAILITNYEGTIVWANPAFTTLTGYTTKEILGKNPRILKSGEQPERLYADLWAKISAGKVWQGEIVNTRKDGTKYTEEMTITPLGHNSDPADRYFIAVKQDVTNRNLLVKQLYQAQKMEAIGCLAGGVAHDFNNMLGVITGYSELLKSHGELDPTSLHYSEEIHLAAKRAASLTQQLLAFSRKQIIQPRILDLNEVVSNLAKMLRRLIGDNIELVMRFASEDARIKVDQGQLEQVIMNLAVNSRDAMPAGGKLIIETGVCDLDESYALHHKPVVPGRYIQLSITDTGTGMDRDTISHVFEPFFTTKELGRGTGLGLSIVYGIVKQSGGYIWVYSEPSHGTTFKIYWPLRSGAVAATVPETRVAPTGGRETVLLVEDDLNLRALMAEFLGGLGYKPIECADGVAALTLAAKQAIPIKALITDIMMPGMNGRELADKLLAVFPKLRVLYISGYTHDSAVQTRVLSEGESFLQKPFALADLSRKLRDVIDAPEERQSKVQASGQS